MATEKLWLRGCTGGGGPSPYTSQLPFAYEKSPGLHRWGTEGPSGQLPGFENGGCPELARPRVSFLAIPFAAYIIRFSGIATCQLPGHFEFSSEGGRRELQPVWAEGGGPYSGTPPFSPPHSIKQPGPWGSSDDPSGHRRPAGLSVWHTGGRHQHKTGLAVQRNPSPGGAKSNSRKQNHPRKSQGNTYKTEEHSYKHLLLIIPVSADVGDPVYRGLFAIPSEGGMEYGRGGRGGRHADVVDPVYRGLGSPE